MDNIYFGTGNINTNTIIIIVIVIIIIVCVISSSFVLMSGNTQPMTAQNPLLAILQQPQRTIPRATPVIDVNVQRRNNEV